MSTITIHLDQLRNMIGIKLHYQGVACQVIEVLEDGPSLVLTSIEEENIQADQYGNPKRKVPQFYTIPVLSADGQSIHPAYLSLDLID